MGGRGLPASRSEQSVPHHVQPGDAHPTRKGPWRQSRVTGLLHSPALPAPPHLVRTRHSVRTQAVRGRGGTSACASPAGTQPPGWHPVGSPDPLGREGVRTPLSTPLHPQQKGPAAQGTGFLCPGQALLTRIWRIMEEREGTQAQFGAVAHCEGQPSIPLSCSPFMRGLWVAPSPPSPGPARPVFGKL